MKKKAKESKQPAKKKNVPTIDVAKREAEERAAKAKSKKVHEDLWYLFKAELGSDFWLAVSFICMLTSV